MSRLQYIFIASILLLSFFRLQAQDLSNLSEKEPVKVNGGVSYNMIGYNAQGIEQRRDPFSWYLNGNLNISLYDFSIPLTFSYTNRQLNYSQPFNQIGLTPTYKWVKGHIGYSNMNFSSYSLSGYTFLGGGVELTPGPWYVGIMYGRLNKATESVALDSVTYTDPVYKRMGYGAKVGYRGDGYHVEMSVFTAKDDVSSVEYIPEDTEITPEDNVVWSLTGGKELIDRLSLEFEYAQSRYNRDIRDIYRDSLGTEADNTEGTFHAYNFGLAYSQRVYSLMLKYERIDPGYETLGAYYNNNDMENITVNGNLNLLRNQMAITLSTGVQRNNLEDTEASSTRRVVGSANVNYSPSSSWNFSASYSNFNTYTNVRPQVDPTFQDEMDTLNFYQVNQSATFNTMYSFGSKEIKKSIMLNGSYQITNEESTEAESAQSTFLSGNLGYRMSLKDGTSASAAINGNRSAFAENVSQSYGPNLTLSKPLMNKNIRSTLSGTYLRQEVTGRPATGVINIRLNFGLKPQEIAFGKRNRDQKSKEKADHKPSEVSSSTGLEMPEEFSEINEKKEAKSEAKNKSWGQHAITLGVSYMKKMVSEEAAAANATNDFSELTITLNYSYRF
ncbi:hypothetical protein LVD15_03670 [Fulvivirga maritima]|uniref:hypothetical protein n=1 Tax=Fulvivirga maritima TaxID=2904247 RepID=UPI001F3108F9|nr:hypothetical protein [Fulvivirga maritima]UII27542.1 hypothetical protein LVD15_03670 [Fulvivirga maritima]